MNFVTGDELPRSPGEHQQHRELLRPELYSDAAIPQFAIGSIKLKWAEANYA
jgi:hypothetical protein